MTKDELTIQEMIENERFLRFLEHSEIGEVIEVSRNNRKFMITRVDKDGIEVQELL